MRNFWIESDIDGRESFVSGGPRRNDGRMSTKLYFNSNGCSTKAVSINCNPNNDGTLEVRVKTCNDEIIDIIANKKEGDIKVRNFFKEAITEILNDKSKTPTQRLKAIKELL